MEEILPFTVYIIALYDNEDPTPSTQIWAVDCKASQLGFFACLKEGMTTNGQWEFRGYTVQKSETIFKSTPHRHFSSIGNFVENIGGILVSWDKQT